MINREVVKDAVFNSMKEKVFHSVVNSAFVNAIPIDKSELDLSTRRGLAKYSFDALEAAGGFSLLEKAIENETDTFKHDYLVAVRDVCTESAMEVASRVAKEYYEANKPGMILSAGNESSKFVDTTKAVANKTYNSTKEIADRTAKLAKKTAQATGKFAGKVAEKTVDMYNQAKPVAKKFGDYTVKSAKKTGELAGKMAGRTAQIAKHTYEQMAKNVYDKFNAKEACEAIRSEVINGINNMNFRDLVSTANEVTNDSIGVLQDVHWTSGVGYFFSYAFPYGKKASVGIKLLAVFRFIDPCGKVEIIFPIPQAVRCLKIYVNSSVREFYVIISRAS